MPTLSNDQHYTFIAEGRTSLDLVIDTGSMASVSIRRSVSEGSQQKYYESATVTGIYPGDTVTIAAESGSVTYTVTNLSAVYATDPSGAVTGLVGPDGGGVATGLNGIGKPLNLSVSKRKVADRPSALASWAWPCLVDTTEVPSITSPLARYYVYTATDHNSRGGVRVLYSDSLDGPWTLFEGGPDSGAPSIVYEDLDDTASRSPAYSTETPSVVYDQTLGKLRLFYHCVNPSYGVGTGSLTNVTDPSGARSGCTAYQCAQGTMSAVQSDGDTSGTSFTKDRSFALDIYWASAGYGLGDHTGYFNPFNVRGAWYAYHLGGGGNAGAMLLSRCQGNDLSNWRTDIQVLPRYTNLLNDAGRAGEQVSWNHCIVIDAPTGLMMLGRSAAIGSGTAIIPGALICAPISDDMRTITGAITVLDSAYDVAWEENALSSHVGWIRNLDGSLDGVFQYTSTMGVYHVG